MFYFLIGFIFCCIIVMFVDYRRSLYLYDMINQSGVESLTLYSALDTSFTRVSSTEITNISGTSILLDNSTNPTLKQTNKIINRKNFFEYTFNATGFGFGFDTSQFKNKFGWLVLITFLDGTTRFLNSPVFFQGTELNSNKTNVRALEFTTERPTGKTLEVS